MPKKNYRFSREDIRHISNDEHFLRSINPRARNHKEREVIRAKQRDLADYEEAFRLDKKHR